MAVITEFSIIHAPVKLHCIVALVDKMEPQLDDAEKVRLRRLITDLQLNYAEQMK